MSNQFEGGAQSDRQDVPAATILIVEDNELNRDMLTRRLKRLGFRTIEAKNGSEGIEMARSSMPNLIIMDMSLPEIDGWEATRLLKSGASTADIPIVALTAHAFEQDRQKALDAGCDEFATKPVVWDELLAKMQALLAKSRVACGADTVKNS